ncbi:MAG: hypothetical protein KOO62_06375 [candidate division Zixibacteria bacterium]|nr:hypothetical protein [candidate division Zixibacteria bacterium]
MPRNTEADNGCIIDVVKKIKNKNMNAGTVRQFFAITDIPFVVFRMLFIAIRSTIRAATHVVNRWKYLIISSTGSDCKR